MESRLNNPATQAERASCIDRQNKFPAAGGIFSERCLHHCHICKAHLKQQSRAQNDLQKTQAGLREESQE